MNKIVASLFVFRHVNFYYFLEVFDRSQFAPCVCHSFLITTSNFDEKPKKHEKHEKTCHFWRVIFGHFLTRSSEYQHCAADLTALKMCQKLIKDTTLTFSIYQSDFITFSQLFQTCFLNFSQLFHENSSLCHFCVFWRSAKKPTYVRY